MSPPQGSEDPHAPQTSEDDSSRRALGEGAAAWSARLAVLVWLLACCCSVGQDKPSAPVADLDAAGRKAYLLTRAVIYGIPSFVAVIAFLFGLRGLRSENTRQRGSAQVGVFLAGGYLVLVWGIGLVATLQQRGFFGTVAQAPQSRAPLTKAEIDAFAARLLSTLRSGDSTFLDSRLDHDALIAKLYPGERISPRLRVEVRASFGGKGSLGSSIVDALSIPNATYSLLRARRRANQPTILFRLVPGSGVNYHEFYLVRGPDGRVSFDDVHLYMGDIRLAQSTKAFSGQDQACSSAYEELIRRERLGDRRAALSYCLSLPVAFQRRKEFLLTRVQLAKTLGEKEYSAALEAIERHALTDHPALALMLIDRFMERGAFDRCKRELDRLNALVGGDPAIGAMVANVLLKQGQLKAAKARLLQAASSEADLLIVQETFLNVALVEQDHPSTLRHLRHLRDRYEVKFAVSEHPDYAEFVKSKEFQAWKADVANPR